eukprot:Tamp_31794.p1 GENE.Tamp_31794~~Tamp_31794.p1  ORF type:complete len:160 (-),score=18.25 Tamp_31794:171-650(-)
MSLGFEYEFRNGDCHVTRVETDGPARAAGMRVGDKIVEVDDMPTTGGQDVLSILNGEPGTSVKILLHPAPKPMTAGVWGMSGAGSFSVAQQPTTVTVVRRKPFEFSFESIGETVSSWFRPQANPDVPLGTSLGVPVVSEQEPTTSSSAPRVNPSTQGFV